MPLPQCSPCRAAYAHDMHTTLQSPALLSTAPCSMEHKALLQAMTQVPRPAAQVRLVARTRLTTARTYWWRHLNVPHSRGRPCHLSQTSLLTPNSAATCRDAAGRAGVGAAEQPGHPGRHHALRRGPDASRLLRQGADLGHPTVGQRPGARPRHAHGVPGRERREGAGTRARCYTGAHGASELSEPDLGASHAVHMAVVEVSAAASIPVPVLRYSKAQLHWYHVAGGRSNVAGVYGSVSAPRADTALRASPAHRLAGSAYTAERPHRAN